MRVLLIEDDKTIVKFLKSNLEAECFTVDAVEDGARGSFLALTNEYDLIILDYVLPKMDGRKICSAIRGDGRDVPIIVLTVKTELETKVDALNLGADDYITKPFDVEELKLIAQKALESRDLRMENRRLQGEVEERYHFDNIIGKSREMREVYATIRQIAEKNSMSEEQAWNLSEEIKKNWYKKNEQKLSSIIKKYEKNRS